tara:strand:- start:1597 stop:1845 length:249 start_codon:yes stop_codon:yes gene_type:complete
MIDPERKIQAVINRLEDEKNLYKKIVTDPQKSKDLVLLSDNERQTEERWIQKCLGIVRGIEIAIDKLGLLINKVTDDSDRKE